MWEAVSNVLTSGNALVVLVFLVVIILVLAILAKAGVFQYHGKGVKFGGESKDALGERFILRKQMDFVISYVKGKESAIREMIAQNEALQVPQYKKEPEYYVKWVLEKLTSYMITNWVMLNNITDDPIRNGVRTKELRLYLSGLTGNGDIEKKLLAKTIDAWGAEILENLHRIREEYKK